MKSTSTLCKHEALEMLVRDHDATKQMFWDYERLVKRQGEPERKAEVIGQLCTRLSMHSQIEEEIFYPAIQAALQAAIKSSSLSDADLQVLKNLVDFDHLDERLLIARLDEMEPEDPDYDATVADLGAHAGPHMYNEEQNLFPLIRKLGLDTLALGRIMAQRRKVLQADVTRAGLPHATTASGAWPAACAVEYSVGVTALIA